MSVRLRLTLSYAGFVVIAGGLLLGAVWLFLLRYVPRGEDVFVHGTQITVRPGRGDLLRDFAPAAAILGVSLLAFGLLGGWLLAGRMLAPLNRITTATRTAATGSLSHRIRLPGRNDEFRELADAFDTMLDQLEAHVAEQQRFAANASHELRTPLAIMQSLLDVARSDPDHVTGELIERLHLVNTRAIELTEALLLLSRADRRQFPRERVDLSLLAETAVETLLPLAEQRGVTIESSTEMSPVIGSEALLLQLTLNLIQNAILHNLNEHGSVWITTSQDGLKSVVTVENTGEEVSQPSVSTLVEPFQRGAERVRGDHAGVGLGLAIVKSVTQAHDGTLSVVPRAGGGLCVTVQFPAAVQELDGLYEFGRPFVPPVSDTGRPDPSDR